MIIGWDLGTHSCGWCAGAGDTVPVAGAFQLVRREVLAELGNEFKGLVLTLHGRFPARKWYVEAPLITPHDARWTLERLLGVTFLLHTLAGALGVECEPVPQDEVKLGWGGKLRHPRGRKAAERLRMNKEAAVRAAERCGILLPSTRSAGRWDAADAAGVWKAGLGKERVPEFNKWDELSALSRGGLL